MAESELVLLAGGYAEATSKTPVHRFDHRSLAGAIVEVAEEVPIAFVYNARPYTVVMGTPLDFRSATSSRRPSLAIVMRVTTRPRAILLCDCE